MVDLYYYYNLLSSISCSLNLHSYTLHCHTVASYSGAICELQQLQCNMHILSYNIRHVAY